VGAGVGARTGAAAGCAGISAATCRGFAVVVTVDSASALGGGAFSADLFSGLMTETGKVDGSGGGGGGVGTTATGAAAALEPSAAAFAAFAPFAPATTEFGAALFAAALAVPDWPWFAVGAT